MLPLSSDLPRRVHALQCNLAVSPGSNELQHRRCRSLSHERMVRQQTHCSRPPPFQTPVHRIVRRRYCAAQEPTGSLPNGAGERCFISQAACARGSTRWCTGASSPCTFQNGRCSSGAAAGSGYSWLCAGDTRSGALPSGGGTLCFSNPSMCRSGAPGPPASPIPGAPGQPVSQLSASAADASPFPPIRRCHKRVRRRWSALRSGLLRLSDRQVSGSFHSLQMNFVCASQRSADHSSGAHLSPRPQVSPVLQLSPILSPARWTTPVAQCRTPLAPGVMFSLLPRTGCVGPAKKTLLDSLSLRCYGAPTVPSAARYERAGAITLLQTAHPVRTGATATNPARRIITRAAPELRAASATLARTSASFAGRTLITRDLVVAGPPVMISAGKVSSVMPVAGHAPADPSNELRASCWWRILVQRSSLTALAHSRGSPR